MLSRIASEYPALAPHLARGLVMQSHGAPGDDRQLEFYHPLDSDNPVPGRLTFEMLRPFNGKERQDAVAADSLHYLGGLLGGNSGAPVDPVWSSLRDKLWASRTPAQRSIDAEDLKSDGRSESEWANRSRKDAYVRAGMFPERNQDWWRAPAGDPEAFTNDQQAQFDVMKQYLTRRK